MTTIDRMNALVSDSFKAAFQAAEAAQRQNRSIAETWLNAIEAGQNIARDLTLGTIERTQEAQHLWLTLLQETTQAGVENFTTVARAGVAEPAPATTNGKRAETAAK
jgi:hypothetical protein